MSQSLGLWMLLAAAATIVITGLPAWVALISVAVGFTALGLASGVLSLALLTALPLRLIGLLESDLLQALPLYVLMGALLHRLPLAELLFRAGTRAAGGGARGGAIAGLGLGVLLAPMSGSVGASVAMLSQAVYPRLAASGMEAARSGALLTVASTLGVVVPPSLVLILLGDAMLRAHTEAVNITHQAQTIINTQDIFHGALLPAGLLLALYLAITWFDARRFASSEPLATPTLTPRQWLVALLALAVIVGLLAAVTLGYLYAVEAAATGALLLFVFGLASGELDRPRLTQVLRDTMAVTGALFALLLAATSFTLVVRAFETDRLLAAWLVALPGGRYGALLLVLGGLALCALVLDAFEMIFMVIPIVMPPLLVIVPDAPWVAVLTLFILQASFMAPPAGYAVLLLRQKLALPHRALARALAPYLVAQALVVVALLIWPGLVWKEEESAPPGAPVEFDLEQQLQQQEAR